MVAITPGTGGTFKSTSAEALLAEIIDFMQLQEVNSIRNPNARDYVRCSYDCNSYTMTASFNFPYIEALNAEGLLTANVPDYLSGTNFVLGSGGTFKSTNVAGLCFEVAKFLDIAERDLNKNPKNENRIIVRQDVELLIATASISLPFTLTPTSTGARTAVITPYLV